MKSFLRALVYSAIFVSICAVALCMETSLLLGLPFNSFFFYLVVFSATLGQYNIHFYIKRSLDATSDHFFWSLHHRRVHLVLNVVGAVGLIVGLTHLRPSHYLVLGVVLVITILYSFPFLPFKKKRRLKDFGLVKIFTLALVWALITVWFPIANLNALSGESLLVFLHRFLFVFVLCILFDIKDIRVDGLDKIGTIPVRLGTSKSYQLSYLMLLGTVVVAFFFFFLDRDVVVFSALTASALVTYFVVEKAKESTSDLYYFLVVDGMMLLQPIFVVLALVGN